MDADDIAHFENAPEQSSVAQVGDVGKGDDESSDTSSATEREDNAELSGKEELCEEQAKLDEDTEVVVQQVLEYVVGPRDTLNSIAAKHNTTPSRYVKDIYFAEYLKILNLYCNIFSIKLLYLLLQIKVAQSIIIKLCIC